MLSGSTSVLLQIREKTDTLLQLFIFAGKRNSLLNHGDYNRSDTAIEFLEEQTSAKQQYDCTSIVMTQLSKTMSNRNPLQLFDQEINNCVIRLVKILAKIVY